MTPDSPDTRRRLLDRVSPLLRSRLLGLFLEAVRGGAKTADETVTRALELAGIKLRSARFWGEHEERAKLQAIIDAIGADDAEAVDLAAWTLEYESLPAAVRARRKAERNEHYRREYMAKEPATPPQLRYLRALGHKGPVASKAEASSLIEQLKTKKATA